MLLIIILLINIYEIGTFLGNCEADRETLELPQKTVSLWSYINRIEILEKFINPLYTPNNKIIWPSVAPMSLVIFRSFLNNKFV